MGGTATGAISNLVAASIGIISAQSLSEAIAVAFVGAVIGYLTNKFLKWLEKKIKQWREK